LVIGSIRRRRSPVEVVELKLPVRDELLAENKELNPSEIARAVGRSVPRVSNVLSALRLADVVPYDSDGKRNYYRLKHPGEIRQVLAALSRVVTAASTLPVADQ
jgi:DNA-binding transcriptional ArsR family regulator